MFSRLSPEKTGAAVGGDGVFFIAANCNERPNSFLPKTPFFWG
jgi:hypothetical protein